MLQAGISKHLTYDKLSKELPDHRQEFLTLKLNNFIRLYSLTGSNWPLDCTRLIRKMKDSGIINFVYGFSCLSEKTEAVTVYMSEHDLYLMHINRNKIRYPFETSADRRLNFTLAHEIGHIMLEHLRVPRELKTRIELAKEEHEANEFAGQLLMPSPMLQQCNFKSFSAVAEFFNVSNSALWMRLNKMSQLSLMQSTKVIPCSVCGNCHLSRYADYCSICGSALKNCRKGVLRLSYNDDIRPVERSSVCTCPICTDDEYSAVGGRWLESLRRSLGCVRSHHSAKNAPYDMYNYCSNGFLTYHGTCGSNILANNARYCENCGNKTTFYASGLLRPWQDVRKALVEQIIEKNGSILNTTGLDRV